MAAGAMATQVEQGWHLVQACRSGGTAAVQRLLDAGAYAGTRNNFVLGWAAYHGHTDVVKALLALPRARGVDPSARDNLALRWAAKNGHTAVVQALLALPRARGVDPATQHSYALRYAAGNGRTAIVQALLALPRGRGVDPGADDNYALSCRRCWRCRWTAAFGPTKLTARRCATRLPTAT